MHVQVCFSYLWERTVAFTRDFESVKSALTKIELYNKTRIEAALAGVSTVVQEEWNTGVPCQVEIYYYAINLIQATL